MSEPSQSATPAQPVEDLLRAELAQGDIIIATTRPILRHLLVNDDQTLFSDEVIARVRGMMVHIARQMLHVVGEKAGVTDRSSFIDERSDLIAIALLNETDFLAHAHALTIEAQIAERLGHRSGIDAVLSPLLQSLAASSDPVVAAASMRALAAQARFMQQQRRMELPIGELPPELFEKAFSHMREKCSDIASAVASAEAQLREEFDPAQQRIQQFAWLISAMQHNATRALEVDHAGVSIFVTALQMASDQPRELVILSLGENQCARFALSLRAAGLNQSAVEEQFLFLHPEITLPDGFESLRSDQASALLAQAQADGSA